MTVTEDTKTEGEDPERTTTTVLLLQEPQAIALHYLQKGFWLDLLLAFPWRGLSALLLLPRRKVRPYTSVRMCGPASSMMMDEQAI